MAEVDIRFTLPWRISSDILSEFSVEIDVKFSKVFSSFCSFFIPCTLISRLSVFSLEFAVPVFRFLLSPPNENVP